MRVQPPLTIAAQLLSWGRKWCAQAVRLSLWVALVVLSSSVSGQESGPSEYQIKAAYLVNFSKYVEWPKSALSSTNPLGVTNRAGVVDTNGPVVIGICGENKFGEDLKQMIQGKVVNGRAFVIERIRADEEPGRRCHILFVSASERRRTGEILSKWGGAGVLTVGETDNFLPQGGIINFALREKKVKLQLNLEAAEKAGLKISSKLIIVSEVWKGK